MKHSSNIYKVIEKPIITEKSEICKESDNVFVFKVLKSANKKDIKKAVEAIFEVEVVNVRTASMRGKERRRGKNVGKTSDWKKAYVQLKNSEQSIPYFEGEV